MKHFIVEVLDGTIGLASDFEREELPGEMPAWASDVDKMFAAYRVNIKNYVYGGCTAERIAIGSMHVGKRDTQTVVIKFTQYQH